MSISTELTRIKNAKSALKTAINAKGGTLTNEKLEAYAAAVGALSGETEFDYQINVYQYGRVHAEYQKPTYPCHCSDQSQ